MSEPYEPCPHHTPNAGGSVDSELHGICIFCWRDRLGKATQRITELEAALRLGIKCLESWAADAESADVAPDPVAAMTFRALASNLDSALRTEGGDPEQGGG